MRTSSYFNSDVFNGVVQNLTARPVDTDRNTGHGTGRLLRASLLRIGKRSRTMAAPWREFTAGVPDMTHLPTSQAADQDHPSAQRARRETAALKVSNWF